VALSFLNDAWGSAAGQDRNLHLSGVSYDGVAQANGSADLMSTGTVTLNVAGSAPAPAIYSVGSGVDSLLLRVSQDAWHGSAQYTVTVDGQQVGGTLSATALHGSGSDSVTLNGTWGSGSHVVAVSFINDAWGSGTGADRNLYIEGMSYAGTTSGASANMMSNGTAWFLAGNPAALPSGNNGHVVQGSSAAEQLYGTAGNDVLIGGPGNDGLTGGAGNDNFVLAQGDGHDWLNDFTHGSDHLVLKGVSAATVTTQLVSYFGTSGTDVHYGTAGDSVFLANVWSVSGADILYA
jgi:Ca2+-binding RTX toxin-like protein